MVKVFWSEFSGGPSDWKGHLFVAELTCEKQLLEKKRLKDKSNRYNHKLNTFLIRHRVAEASSGAMMEDMMANEAKR